MIYQAIDNRETIKNNYELISEKFNSQTLKEQWNILFENKQK
jgi:hypothetical protein